MTGELDLGVPLMPSQDFFMCSLLGMRYTLIFIPCVDLHVDYFPSTVIQHIIILYYIYMYFLYNYIYVCLEYHSLIKHVHGELVFPDYFARFHIISQRGSSTGGLPNLAME